MPPTVDRQTAVRRPSILLVDDEDSLRTLLADALGRRGFFVLTARDGEDAVRVAAEARATPTVLVTDVRMPRMDGPTLASRLRGRLGDLKVLYMSGTPSALPDAERVRRDTWFLAKPFRPSELAGLVRGLLDGEDARKPPSVR